MLTNKNESEEKNKQTQNRKIKTIPPIFHLPSTFEAHKGLYTQLLNFFSFSRTTIILNQFRTYFPNTISVMMDEETLQKFSGKEGKPAPEQQLLQLTKTEHQLYEYVRANNLRLEQEKITLEYALGKIKQSVEICS